MIFFDVMYLNLSFDFLKYCGLYLNGQRDEVT